MSPDEVFDRFNAALQPHEEKEFAEDRKSNKFWIQTYTGRKFFPLQPKVGDLCFIDQAQSLSRICRYGGHTTRHLSVAEHSWRMSVEAERRGYDDVVRKWCLIHDNAESYVGDLVRPLKVQNEFEVYRKAEGHLTRMIATWLGLPSEEPAQVRALDTEILHPEALAVKQPLNPDWKLPETTWQMGDLDLWGVPAEEAFRLYMWRFRVLWGDQATRIVPDLWKWMGR